MEKQNSLDNTVKRVIKSVERDKLIKDLKSFDKAIDAKKESSFSWKKWISTAAIVLLSFVVIYYMNTKETLSSEEIYNTHFSIYKNTVEPIVRGENIKEMSTRKKAFTYYELKKYEQALATFDSITHTNNREQMIINFYKANIHLQLNNPQKALSLLENSSIDDSLKDQILWYKGLTYLKLDDIYNAKITFELLQNSSDYKKEKVSGILKILSDKSSED